MASRSFTQFQSTLDKGMVTLRAVVKIGASGAATLQQFAPNPDGTSSLAAAPTAGWQGVKSVARTAAGKYTVTLQDKYLRRLGARATVSVSGGLPAATSMAVDSAVGDLTESAAGTSFGVVFSQPEVTGAQFTAGTTATLVNVATELDDGAIVTLTVDLQNSSAV